MFQRAVKVKKVGTDLVASFESAEPALVWKFDLQRYHSFTVALKSEEADWVLGVTSPRDQFYPVAHFPIRRDAEVALKKVHKVLTKKESSTIAVIKYLAVLAMLVLGMFLIVECFSKHGLSYIDVMAPVMKSELPVSVTNSVPVTSPISPPAAVVPLPEPVSSPLPSPAFDSPGNAPVPESESKPPAPVP